MALENTYLSIIKKENLSNWFIEIEATQITRLQYNTQYTTTSAAGLPKSKGFVVARVYNNTITVHREHTLKKISIRSMSTGKKNLI